MMNKACFTIGLMFFYLNLFAQEQQWNKLLLEQTNGKKIVRWEAPKNEGDSWTAIVQVNKKVGVYEVGISEEEVREGELSPVVAYFNVPIKAAYDEIGEFRKVDKEDSELVDDLQGQVVEVAEVLSKKKKGIIVRYGDDYDRYYINANHFFQSIEWESNEGTAVPVMLNEKWGLYDWLEQEFVFNCDYSSLAALPKSNDPYGFTPYSAEIFKAFNKRSAGERIDMIDLDGNNGDGLFKARSAETRKWGIYQYLGDDFIEAVPMEYDSLYHFPWNGNYTAVFNEGKVGFYLSYWTFEDEAKLSVPCIYEDYKRYITEDQIPKLAVKKDGKWGWVDWLTGEEKSEFVYDTPKDLPYPWYVQGMWFED